MPDSEIQTTTYGHLRVGDELFTGRVTERHWSTYMVTTTLTKVVMIQIKTDRGYEFNALSTDAVARIVTSVPRVTDPFELCGGD